MKISMGAINEQKIHIIQVIIIKRNYANEKNNEIIKKNQ